MTRPANYVRPIQLSLQVLREAGIRSFPVSLMQILRHYGIRLMSYEDFYAVNDCDIKTCITQFGPDGATIESGGMYLIVYNKNATPKDRIRFTLAHELGHIFLKHHAELGLAFLRRLQVEKNLYAVMEDEANCFARNLLCPAPAVFALLRRNGFYATEYDDTQNRTIWRKTGNALIPPHLTQNLTDSFLVRQSFMVTEAAAKTRIGFLKQDQRCTPVNTAAEILDSIRFNAQWRCRKCGAPWQPGSEYCYHCGSRNRFSLLTAENPPVQPVQLHYRGGHYAFCPVCGNPDIPDGSVFCPICGNAVSNPCIPGRVRNRTVTHLLELAAKGTSHSNPPGARYCLTCGAPTLYGSESAENEILLWDYLKFPLPGENEQQGGYPIVKYGPKIPYTLEQGEYRVNKCPVCLNEENDEDAEFCILCGTSLTNLCEGNDLDYNDELIRHSNPANARFCYRCGAPTAYSHLKILPNYREALRSLADKEAIRRELADMDVDEELFWQMQDENEAAEERSDPDESPFIDLTEPGDDIPF